MPDISFISSVLTFFTTETYNTEASLPLGPWVMSRSYVFFDLFYGGKPHELLCVYTVPCGKSSGNLFRVAAVLHVGERQEEFTESDREWSSLGVGSVQ